MNCKICEAKYDISKDDEKFYKKLDLTSPTLCPICRNKRRMAWRNDRSFYIRNCDRSNEQFISIYPKKTPFPVWRPKEWYKDDWDPRDHGQEFDFSRPFFEQWNELLQKVPRLGIDIVHCENSEYCNYCGDDKNCYLDIAGEANEDCYFNLFTKYSRDCADNTFVYKSDLCYESLHCHTCHNVRYSMHMEGSADCAFCFDCKSCQNCLFSYNLRHKKYHIFNEPHTKEEYEKKLQELNLGSYSNIQLSLQIWKDKVIAKAIHRDQYNVQTEECEGNNIKNSKNCKETYNATNCWDSSFLYDVLDAKDCRDLNYSLYKPEVAAELISTLELRYSAFNMASHYCHEVFYCDMINNSHHLFGCISINRGQYCILNKQYTEEEYKELFPKIKEHMKKTGEWGEFFPPKYSPPGYNETVAQEYFPLTEDQAAKEGFNWKPKEKTPPTPQTYTIPNNIKEVPQEITKETLACETCGKNFRIIEQELRFYKRQNIPVPHNCPDCRHFARHKLRNPRILNDSTCSKCETPIKTTYRNASGKLIFCEKCYLGEIH
jgi:hypothetical protein